MTEATLFLPGLSPVGGKTITATFDGGKRSSNGGVLILREIERRLGLAAVLSRHIPDDRDRMRITHSYSDMTRARMFAIASGHEDCDDLDVLRSDPALKMACGRLPVSGTDLMSQPTLSRLENAPFWRQLARMGLELIDLFCARFERVPRCIVLDRDRAALERGCRHRPSVVKNGKDAALLPDQLCRSQLEQAPQGRRPRRGERARQRHTLHRHQPARPGKSPLRKGLLRTRAHGESHQGHEALHALRPHLLPPLGGQSVPPVPSHGGLLAPARTQGRRAKTLNLAHSNLRDHPLHVPQDRCAHPRAQDPHQDGAALKLSACSSLDRARHLNRRPRSMNDAASAALAPQLQTPTRRECPRASTTVNPVDVMRSHRQSPALTNNWG